MSTVLLEEKAVRLADGGPTIPVLVTLLLEGDELAFEPVAGKDYVIDVGSITLAGSGGTPREFVLTFALSANMVEAGYRLANPALKFFQGSTRGAGFRFPPADPPVQALVALFNTLTDKDAQVKDEFRIFYFDPDGKHHLHDPTIVWDPPGGG